MFTAVMSEVWLINEQLSSDWLEGSLSLTHTHTHTAEHGKRNIPFYFNWRLERLRVFPLRPSVRTH